MGLFITMKEIDLISQFEATKNYFKKQKYLRLLNAMYAGATHVLDIEDYNEADEFLPCRIEDEDALR